MSHGRWAQYRGAGILLRQLLQFNGTGRLSLLIPWSTMQLAGGCYTLALDACVVKGGRQCAYGGVMHLVQWVEG
jgi:hypothetical protein